MRGMGSWGQVKDSKEVFGEGVSREGGETSDGSREDR